MGILANSPDQRFTTQPPPIEEVDSGDARSNKLDTSGHYQDKTSHHMSGQDPAQDVDFDDNDHEVAKVVNVEGGR